MAFETKRIVYRSKDEEDWKMAQKLLTDAGVDFHEWKTSDVPAGGCGAKLDVRKLSGKKVPKTIYHIEVANKDYGHATSVLLDRVKPVLSYGAGL